MAKNAIVGQSGGPTSVINASLAGVYESCKRRGAGKVYGMLHGVAGLLERRTCVLDEKLQSALDIELLKRTPSSFLGSCRHKLPDPAEQASAGSFFKNIHFTSSAAKAAAEAQGIPVFGTPGHWSLSSGWLIEHAGLKGQLLHGMRVSSKAALILINESAQSYAV